MRMSCFCWVLYCCVLLSSTVVGTQSEYPAQLSSACKNADITIDCGVGEQIHVIGAYSVERSGGRGSHCAWTPADCLQNVKATEFTRITDSCRGQNTCTVRAEMESTDPECGTGQTDYQVIEYRCVPEDDNFPPGDFNIIHSCDRDLNTPVCSGDTVIDVSAAYYMDIGGLTTDCTRRSLGHDCRSPVQPSYLEEIKDKCNQNQACEDLDQRTDSNTPCSPGDWNVGTEYVAIVYRCVTATDPESSGDEEVTTDSRDGTESTVSDVTLTNPPSTSGDGITTTDPMAIPTTGSSRTSTPQASPSVSNTPTTDMTTVSVSSIHTTEVPVVTGPSLTPVSAAGTTEAPAVTGPSLTPVSATHTTEARVIIGSSLTTGAVIGIAAAAAFIVIIIIVVMVFVIRKRKKDSQSEKQMESSAYNNKIYGDDDIIIGEQRPAPSAPRQTLVCADPEYSLAQYVPASHNNESTPVPKYEMVDDIGVGRKKILTIYSPGYEMVSDFGKRQSEDGTAAAGFIPTENNPTKASYSKVNKPVKSDDTVLIDNAEYAQWEEDGDVEDGQTAMTNKQSGARNNASVNNNETETVFVDNQNYAGWDETKSSSVKADIVIVDNQNYAEWDETKEAKPKGDTVLVDNQNYAEWAETNEPKHKGDTLLVDNQNYAE